MITVKELKQYLGNFDDNAEVLLPNNKEINHISLTRIGTDGYGVVLKNKFDD